MRKTRNLASLCIVMSLVSSSFVFGQTLKGDIANLYLQHCANCHGDEMQGAMADSLVNNTWTTAGTDAALVDAISDGITNKGMPAWKSVLNAEQIRAMVVLIREQTEKVAPAKKWVPEDQKFFDSKLYRLEITTVAEGTDVLWGMDFLADGSMLVTQKNGILWHFKDGKRSQIKGIPSVWHHSQGGLLDVFVHPDDKKAKREHPWIYLSYADKVADKLIFNDKIGATTAVRGKIKNGQWVEQQIIFQQEEDERDNYGIHFGSRFAYRDGYLFLSLGEENKREKAQDLSTLNGKIMRFHDDGRIPKDNPFVNHKNALPSIWSYGHRNPQGLDTHPETGELWNAEHGPRGGDEVNLVLKGANYGWPIVTYGMNYDGTPISAKTSAPGLQDPKHYWVPSIAPCGMEFYEGQNFPLWKNNLFVAALAGNKIVRLEINNNNVVDEEVITYGLGRVRDLASGPDGNVYALVNGKKNRVIKISPAEKPMDK